MSTVSTRVARASLFLFVLALLGAGVAHAQTGSVNFTLGYKHLTTDWSLGAPQVGANGDTLTDNNPSQPGLGIETSWGKRGWPVWVALDVMHSYDDGLQHFPFVNLGTDTIAAANAHRRASTLELGIGLRRAWQLKSWGPYIGAGGSWVHATVIDEVIDPSLGVNGTVVGSQYGHDSSFGYWIGGGLMKLVGPRFQIGLTARITKAKVTLPDTRVVGEAPNYHYTGNTREVEAGGRHIGLVIGWSFTDRK